MVTSVSIPEGVGRGLILSLIGPQLGRDLLSPKRLLALDAIAGVQFLFDARGTYMDEVNAWQIDRALRTPSRHTRATRSSALKAVAGWFEQQNLRWQDCTELAHMNLMRLSFRSADAAVVNKGTWNQWMDHWYPFLRYAEREDHIDGIGFEPSDLKERGTSSQAVRALSGAEFRQFVGAADSQRMRAGCHTCMGTGIRVAELATLKVSDVPDPESPKHKGRSYLQSRIVGKGQKERTIYWPIHAVKAVAHYVHHERAIAVEALVERVRRGEIRLEDTYLTQPKGIGATPRERPEAPLWVAENGDPLSYNRWGKDFARIREKSGVYCSPHYLRHSYAIVTLSMLIKAQIRQEIIESQLGTPGQKRYFMDPLREVQQRLGHVSIETTMVYLDHIAEHRAIIAMAMGELQAMYFDA
jgi:site-specific recombinase XerD